jgi:hypothetical protein
MKHFEHHILNLKMRIVQECYGKLQRDLQEALFTKDWWTKQLQEDS